ncbi:MAG: phospho-N-acetylmuramoyl-pentapeptide-transferase [Anaerolineae bacterium]
MSLPWDWRLVSLLVAAGLSFAATVIATRPLIGRLRDRQYGKAIRTDGPDHEAKSGTPTMGGLAALAVIAVGGLIIAYLSGEWRMMPLILAVMACYAVLGLADDLAGLANRSAGRELGVGLTARRMFALQSLVAIGGCWLLYPGGLTLDRLALVAVGAVAVVGTVNGVNMSDGLDGLAAGLCAIAFSALGLITLIGPAGYVPADPVAVAVFCWITVGACLGFLVYNRHPAQVFMGNVTSMALGAGLALAALSTDIGFLLLPVVGAVFVAEVLSVIAQVGYFKASGGRRVFRMAPIHHHFELGGWPETTVVRRFWSAGLLAGLVGIALAAIAAGYAGLISI